MTRQSAIDAILKERARQNRLKREGRFLHTCADFIPDGDKMTILVEEVGEIARAIQVCDEDNLREEVVQCAAICLAWLEAL